jgi:hypothetical protein
VSTMAAVSISLVAIQLRGECRIRALAGAHFLCPKNEVK